MGDKPERLVALLSGVYSASAGYQPSADDLKTVAEIANNQIPFKDLNQKQLSVIGRVIGAMQTGAVSADEASDDDYIRLNVATLPVKAPSGIYAVAGGADHQLSGHVSSADYYTQKYYGGSLPAAADYASGYPMSYASGYPMAYPSGYASGYPSFQRYPSAYRRYPYSGSSAAASGFSSPNPFRFPAYPSYPG